MKKELMIFQNGQPCYPIIYSTESAELTAAVSSSSLNGRRACIITDSNVAPLYAETVAAALSPCLMQKPDIYIIPAGEEHKNLETIESIYRFLIEKHYDRKSFLVALGGGVVGDMTGFTAATYLRGIDYMQIPTTLLSQADSSIGGKTGVDLEGYKNMVGAFKMPTLVFANVAFLKTLDGLQFSSGFAEIMKHGLIRDEEYYVWLLDHMVEIRDRDEEILSDMLYTSNLIKKEIVEKDPFEKGDRMLLNFGHTLGHAIEKYKNFKMTHGECVALGCVAASYISWKRGLITMEDFYEIRDMFVPFGLPISITDIDMEAILNLTLSDKKMDRGQIRFVLLNGIGRAFVDTTVSHEEMLDALKMLLWTEED